MSKEVKKTVEELKSEAFDLLQELSKFKDAAEAKLGQLQKQYRELLLEIADRSKQNGI